MNIFQNYVKQNPKMLNRFQKGAPATAWEHKRSSTPFSSEFGTKKYHKNSS